MKILLLSKTFPAHHYAAGEQTLFLPKVFSGFKIHTIRSNKKGHFKEGDLVEIRQWSGKPYRSSQARTGLVFKIGIEPVTLVLHYGRITASVKGYPVSAHELSCMDGLDLFDFAHWFFKPGLQTGTFTGDIIHFTPFRYVRATCMSPSQPPNPKEPPHENHTHPEEHTPPKKEHELQGND